MAKRSHLSIVQMLDYDLETELVVCGAVLVAPETLRRSRVAGKHFNDPALAQIFDAAWRLYVMDAAPDVFGAVHTKFSTDSWFYTDPDLDGFTLTAWIKENYARDRTEIRGAVARLLNLASRRGVDD